MEEDLSKIIKRRRETILRLIEEGGRVREQEPEKAEQIDAQLKTEFKVIQEEIRSLRKQLVFIPFKEEAMTETKNDQTAPQPVIEISDDEKKKREERRKENIDGIEAKMGRIKAELEKNPGRPDKQKLEDRFNELKGWLDRLKRLNENKIFNHHISTRRADNERTRWHGIW